MKNTQLNPQWVAVCCAISVALSGCASPIQSKRPSSKDGTENTGVVYALPKGQVQLTAIRKKFTDDDVEAATKAATEAATALANDKKALAEAKAALVLAIGARDSAAAVVKNELTAKAAVAQAVVDFLTIKVTAEAKTAAAADQSAKDALAKNGKWVESVSITQLAVVPDAHHRFIAYLDHGVTRDDTMKISVVGGLLSTTAATTADQTTSIVLNLVQAAAGFSGAPSTRWSLREFPVKPLALDECKARSFSRIFDPTDDDETAAVLADFNQLGTSAKVEVEGFSVKSVMPISAPEKPLGLVYRAQRAVRINISAADQVAGKTCVLNGPVDAASFVAIVPDSKAEFVLGSKAGPFTKSTFDFAFKEGMLTDYGVSQPSELAAVASLPLDILKAIISVPASIIKLRVDYDSQANAQIEAKTAALSAQLDQLNAQRALDAARKDAESSKN